MTNTEFSNEFNILYNNLDSNIAPDLNEYEKSVLLTEAQEEILKNYFNPLGNKYREGFDDSEKRQIDFSNIIYSTELLPLSNSNNFDERIVSYPFIEDAMFILNEIAKVRNNKGIVEISTISPINYDEYQRVMSKPYKEPYKQEVWRIINNNSSNETTLDLIPKTGSTITSYKIRYVKKPKPIILEDLSAYNLSINGISTESETDLNTILHREILNRAVEKGKIAYSGNTETAVQLNTRNE